MIENFILGIIKAYNEARKSRPANSKIHRGRSHSISSIAEDLFANYLVANDEKIELIFVDQPIYLKAIKQFFYPDITIVKKGAITAFMDLKMDLGWSRNELVKLCIKHGQTVLNAKGEECNVKDGITKLSRPLKISKRVTYSVVIINRRNSGNNLDSQAQDVKKLRPSIDLFLLCNSTSYHTNRYNVKPRELVDKLAINKKAFKQLLKKIN